MITYLYSYSDGFVQMPIICWMQEKRIKRGWPSSWEVWCWGRWGSWWSTRRERRRPPSTACTWSCPSLSACTSPMAPPCRLFWKDFSSSLYGHRIEFRNWRRICSWNNYTHEGRSTWIEKSIQDFWFLSISPSWSSASPCSWKVMMMRATKMLTKKKGKTMKKTM